MNEPITLDASAFAALCANSQVISSHRVFGPKVLRLSNGNYFKVFNPKSGFTKRHFFPKYKTFIRNAEHLSRYKLPCIQIKQVYFLSQYGSYAVEYVPLEGKDLRSLANQNPELTLREFLPFLVQLHEKGIYFRGIHLGNVLSLSGGGYGVIDMADLYFTRGPLSIHKRVRNLRHLLNNKDDAPVFERFGVQNFLNLYEEKANLLDISRWIYRFWLLTSSH